MNQTETKRTNRTNLLAFPLCPLLSLSSLLQRNSTAMDAFSYISFVSPLLPQPFRRPVGPPPVFDIPHAQHFSVFHYFSEHFGRDDLMISYKVAEGEIFLLRESVICVAVRDPIFLLLSHFLCPLPNIPSPNTIPFLLSPFRFPDPTGPRKDSPERFCMYERGISSLCSGTGTAVGSAGTDWGISRTPYPTGTTVEFLLFSIWVAEGIWYRGWGEGV